MFLGGFYGSQANGLLDEVRIWNVARTEAQIAANKDGELTGPQTGLVGYWPMNEGTGLILHDVSGSGRDVDLTSAGYTSASWTNGRYSVADKSDRYRYAFNGKELDQDIGEDDYNYGMRIYDARLGRFLSTDPLQTDYPELTTYQYASNTPIQANDLDGLEQFYYARTTDNKGNTVLTPLGSKPIVESKQISTGYSSGRSAMADPQPTYKTVQEVNQRQEYIVYSPIERPITRATNVTWEIYQGIATFNSYESALNSKDGDFRMQTSDLVLHYAVQGLINVGEEYKEGNVPGSKRFSDNTPTAKTNNQATAANGGNTTAANSNQQSATNNQRPSWQQSEDDIVTTDYQQQVSFKNGNRVRDKSRGSVRPEGYRTGTSIEVKNYALTTEKGIKSMIRNVIGQVKQRQANLPANTIQNIVLDVRGQNLSAKQMMTVRSRLMTQSGSKNINISFRAD